MVMKKNKDQNLTRSPRTKTEETKKKPSLKQQIGSKEQKKKTAIKQEETTPLKKKSNRLRENQTQVNESPRRAFKVTKLIPKKKKKETSSVHTKFFAIPFYFLFWLFDVILKTLSIFRISVALIFILSGLIISNHLCAEKKELLCWCLNWVLLGLSSCFSFKGDLEEFQKSIGTFLVHAVLATTRYKSTAFSFYGSRAMECDEEGTSIPELFSILLKVLRETYLFFSGRLFGGFLVFFISWSFWLSKEKHETKDGVKGNFSFVKMAILFVLFLYGIVPGSSIHSIAIGLCCLTTSFWKALFLLFLNQGILLPLISSTLVVLSFYPENKIKETVFYQRIPSQLQKHLPCLFSITKKILSFDEKESGNQKLLFEMDRIIKAVSLLLLVSLLIRQASKVANKKRKSSLSI